MGTRGIRQIAFGILALTSAAAFGAHDREWVELPVIDKQDIRFKLLSMSDGLSQTVVLSMIEDEQGFIWLGTPYGLNRYDSHKCKLFTPDPQFPDSLSGVTILSSFSDHSGSLWVGNDRILDCSDANTETFTPYRLASEGPQEKGVIAHHMTEDRSSVLWLATNKGLRRLDPATGLIPVYQHNPNGPASLSDSYVRSGGGDRAGRYWVTTSKGLDRFDRQSAKVTLPIPLPDAFRQEPADALVRLDSRVINEVIARVAERDPQASEFLSRAAKRLAHGEILQALEECGAGMGKDA